MLTSFWTGNQRAFFDVRTLEEPYRGQEKDKRRCYDQQIRDIEVGSFSPLVVFNHWWHGKVNGNSLLEIGMAKSTAIVYWRLANMIAEKNKEPYSQVITWMRCRLSFSLLR